MRTLALAILLLALVSVLLAQEKPYSSHAYAYFAVGGPSQCFCEGLGLGGGVDGFLYKGLALGGDVGYFYPRSNFACGFGLASVSPSYHFVNRKNPGKLAPFVTGGYSLAFRSGAVNLVHYGGGVTYWFSRKLGLRVEIRDHRNPGERGSVLFIRMSVAGR